MNKSQKDLVKYLVQHKIITKQSVAEVMEKVDRKFYAPKHPYEDSPQLIGYGATISAPHMHAYALQYLHDKLLTSKFVLDVGSGTGYLTAAMALLAPKQCKVFGIQHVAQLAVLSKENIQISNPQLLSQKIRIQVGDGRLGWLHDKGIQFDVIHVGAAASQLPEKLLNQLSQGGKMIIPFGPSGHTQLLLQLNKVQGKIVQKTICEVRYVPLTDLKRQLN